MWPELVVVHWKPIFSQSQGSTAWSNINMHNMLTTWTGNNELTICLHKGIRRSLGTNVTKKTCKIVCAKA